jgi:hypothetical protein
MTRTLLAGLALWLSISPAGAQTSQPADRAPAALCQLSDHRIDEASGIAASRANPGCYYVHNDSGDKPRVFLVDRQGRTRATLKLRGAAAEDYEDIALAPGRDPNSWDVCVADIGDNKARRPHVVIYRFADVATPDRLDAEMPVAVTATRVRYADGPCNAEAFCVHPRTGDGYILSKHTGGHVRVYKLAAPWGDRDPTTARELPRVAEFDLPPAVALAHVITAADIAPDGRRLAVRCYMDGWEWRLPPGTADSAFDRVFASAPTRLTLPAEQQGEALCYSPDGHSLLTVSEGATPTLWETPAP